jgi:hypothetical protein
VLVISRLLLVGVPRFDVAVRALGMKARACAGSLERAAKGAVFGDGPTHGTGGVGSHGHILLEQHDAVGGHPLRAWPDAEGPRRAPSICWNVNYFPARRKEAGG